MPDTVGLVGLGNMGRGMAHSLLRAGFPLAVYDLRPEPVAEMVAAGARPAADLAELGAIADTVVTMVLSFPQMEAVLLAPDGLASTLKAGATIIACSTIAPQQARQMGVALAARGLSYVDAPVSGGKIRAEEGALTIMAGADEAVFAAQRPLLEALAANLYYCGPVGAGQTAKMCNQLMAGVTLVASAECLALAAAAGLDRRLLFDIVTHSTGDCWMFRNRATSMIEGHCRTNSQLDIFLKDLGIVLETADQFHLPLLLATAARQWFAMSSAAGYAAEDDANVIRLMEQFAGVSAKAD